MMTRRKLCFFLFLLAEAFSVESVPFISDHRLLLLLRGGEDEGSSTTNVESKPSFYFGASKPGDGSDEDPDGLPTRFLNMQKGDREKAKEAFSHTVQWRDEHNITTLLEQAHPKFDLCKRVFPVYIPGRDTTNNIVVIQRPGLLNFDLAEQNGIEAEDLLRYYVYLVEYCWNILEPSPNAVMTTVMDLKGVHFKTIRDGKVRDFFVKFVRTMSDHYPSRSHKTLIINCPGWINMMYKLVKPLLRESTKQKITLLNGGKKQDKMLIEILGVDAVPKELLNDPSLLEEGQTESTTTIEGEIRSFVLARLEENGDVMQEAV